MTCPSKSSGMVAIPGFYDKAEDRARRFEVEDLARSLPISMERGHDLRREWRIRLLTYDKPVIDETGVLVSRTRPGRFVLLSYQVDPIENHNDAARTTVAGRGARSPRSHCNQLRTCAPTATWQWVHLGE